MDVRQRCRQQFTGAMIVMCLFLKIYGLEAAQTSVVSFEPCATEEKAFNYELQRPITEELYELFKPFGYINKDLGNKRLGEVFVLNKAGKVVLILQGRLGSTKLKVTIKDIHIAKSRTLSAAEGKIQCQITKYQMCFGEKGIVKIYNLSSVMANDYLDRLDTAGYIRVDRTAGLDMIYPVRELNPRNIIEDFYENN